MKITFITTILNEEDSIEKLLNSLDSQTLKPNEIIIADGKSTDKTVDRIKNYELRIKREGIVFKLIVKEGNRSKGRNTAIKSSTGDIIVCSDAGCVLDKDWIKNITKPFEDSSVDVVAGYYKGIAKNVFQKCLIPYALVMPDHVDPNNFLPATRSVAFRKKVWEKVGGFEEKYSHNEDYVFAKSLKRNNFNIVFEKSAVVYWYPPKTFKKAFVMFFRFAKGDAESKIYRPKALLILGRYASGMFLIILFFLTHSLFILILILLLSFNYILWSILKNYKYVNKSLAFFFLPLLQFVSDIAVISGTFLGLFARVWK